MKMRFSRKAWNRRKSRILSRRKCVLLVYQLLLAAKNKNVDKVKLIAY